MSDNEFVVVVTFKLFDSVVEKEKEEKYVAT